MTMEEHRKEAQVKVDAAKLALHDAKDAAWKAANELAVMFGPYAGNDFSAKTVSQANSAFDDVQRRTQELEHAKAWLAQVSSLADRMAQDDA